MDDTTTKPARKPRKPPARSVRLLIRAEGDAPAALEIAVGRKSDAYLVSEIPADWGRGFLVEKPAEGTSYHVNVSSAGVRCECRGFLRWHHCKHGDGIVKLISLGKL